MKYIDSLDAASLLLLILILSSSKLFSFLPNYLYIEHGIGKHTDINIIFLYI